MVREEIRQAKLPMILYEQKLLDEAGATRTPGHEGVRETSKVPRAWAIIGRALAFAVAGPPATLLLIAPSSKPKASSETCNGHE